MSDDTSSVGSSSDSSSSSKDHSSSSSCAADHNATLAFFSPSGGKAKFCHLSTCQRYHADNHTKHLTLTKALARGMTLCSKCPPPPAPPSPELSTEPKKKNKPKQNNKQMDQTNKNQKTSINKKKKNNAVPIVMVHFEPGKNKGHLTACPRCPTKDDKNDNNNNVQTICYAEAQRLGIALCSKCPSPHDGEDRSSPFSWCDPPPAKRKSDSLPVTPFTSSPYAPLVSMDHDNDENGGNKLIYRPYTEHGDRVLDWSVCGYRRSEVPLPTNNVQVVETLSCPNAIPDHCPNPTSNEADQTMMMMYPNYASMPCRRDTIQQALDRVGESKHGGAVVLEAGTWYLHTGGLVIPSNVVLRGSRMDDENDGTVTTTQIIATPPSDKENDTIVWVNKGGGNIRHLNDESRHTIVPITDDYVPSGSRQVTVSDASDFNKDDYICIVKTTNDKWIETIGCGERLRHIRGGKEGAKKKPWKAEAYQFQHIGQITHIDKDSNTIHLDHTLPQSIQKIHGGGKVYKVLMKKLGTECGVEHLEIISNYDTTVSDNQKKSVLYRNYRTGIQVTNCQHGWVRNCIVRNVSFAAVLVGKHTRNITVRNCQCLHPVGPKRGGEQYAFCIDDGSLHLFYQCYSEDGRHDFVGGARTVGPFAFCDCTAVRGEQSEPHHRWGCGFLFDHITTNDGNVAALNRGDSGTGHGWAAANTMIWNASAKGVVVFAPETKAENNFAIGYRGPATITKHNSSAVEYANTRAGYWGTPYEGAYYGYALMGNGHIESPDKPVKPDSLFVQQLIDRIGKKKADAVLN